MERKKKIKSSEIMLKGLSEMGKALTIAGKNIAKLSKEMIDRQIEEAKKEDAKEKEFQRKYKEEFDKGRMEAMIEVAKREGRESVRKKQVKLRPIYTYEIPQLLRDKNDKRNKD